MRNIPINTYFDTLFAVSGDRTAVPDPTQAGGTVSYQQGYSISYSTPVADGGYDFPRNQHNQILYDITAAIQYIQQNGAPPFITTAMNGGSNPYSYNLGAIVSYNAGSGTQNYVSTAATNTTTPGAMGAHWSPILAQSSPLFIGGTTTGSANAQAVATNQADFVNTAGNIVTFKAGISGTGAGTLSVDTVSNIPLKVGVPLGLRSTQQGDIVIGVEYIGISDGTNIQILNPTPQRIALTGSTTYYVATTGSDSTGNGTSGTPWATIQHAINFITNNVDLAGQVATVQLADGTYAGFNINGPFVGGGVSNLIINGNSVTPSNVLLTSASTASTVQVNNDAGVTLQNMKISQTGSASACQVYSGILYFGVGIVFGPATGGSHVACGLGGEVVFTANYTIAGGAGQHAQITGNGEIAWNGDLTMTVSGTPAFTTFAFASAGILYFNGGCSFSGSATGVYYNANLNGVIQTQGGGPTFFPGNSAGSTATGGQYA